MNNQGRAGREPSLARVAAPLLLGALLWPLTGKAQSQTVIFQPGFHQALHWTENTWGRVTHRLKIPVGRSGNRVRVAFKAGDRPLELYAATIALAGTGGALASEAVPLTFNNGSRAFSASPRQRVPSDPVNFSVTFGAELYVSFEVDGELAISGINAFPDSYVWNGSYAAERTPPPGTPFMRARALDTIDVEGAPDRTLVALGDSITEGYIISDIGPYHGYNDDYRNAWPAVAQGILRVPFVNASVSAQGVNDAIRDLDAEVLTLQGITDCAVLLGTNDLHAMTPEQLEARLGDLLNRLRPFCRLWMGTLLPKEITDPDYPIIAARRVAVNDWIRHRAPVAGVIDFEAVTARSDDVNRFRPGLGSDGIHPTIAGQRVMGEEAARVMAPPKLVSLSPESGSSGGGDTVALRGENFKPGAAVAIGGVAGSEVMVATSSSLTFKAPPHASGRVDVSVTNPDGLSSTLARAFTYVDAAPTTEPSSPSNPPAKRSGCNVSSGGWLSGPLLWASFLWMLGVRRRSRTRAAKGSSLPVNR